MKLSNKKLKEITYISVVKDILKDYIGSGVLEYSKLDVFDSPPDTWNKEETSLFDMLYDLENRLKDKLIEIINK